MERDNNKMITQELQSAVKTIKAAILQSQARAIQMVNQEQLSLYYGIGRYVSEHSRKGYWGTGAIGTISKQLKSELPGLKGFSEENIKLMRRFYETWKDIETISVVGTTEITNFNTQGHSANSVVETTDLQKADSDYIQIAYQNRMKADDLESAIKNRVYDHRNALPNNFFKTIPDRQLALRTIQTFKDSYLLDYINVEDIDESDPINVDERVIESSIVMNIKNFIMTFGKSFTYKGHQVHYDKFGHDHWIDLLFYNRELQALVVVELKKGQFKPSYLGQLAAYLRILDDDEKLPNENPSVGIILCKKADRAYVEYVLQDYVKPMGVATYKHMQERLRELLPPEEEMKRLMSKEEQKDDE